ncbi:MAG: DNA polymerase III subunit delta [Cyclobacteriaceae bacterium]|nr:DNA polymerase III subunit delta [Cyclobacteriaceae bacterium]
MKFADIPGLHEVKSRLTGSVRDGKIAHAQLLMGREGALNLPVALAYATYLHCTNRGPDDACGVCPACSKSLKYIHPDTHFVFPVSNVKGDKDEDRFKADILKGWRSFLLENPFGNVGDWTVSYGGEDKQAIISREEGREIIKTLSLKPFESAVKIMIIWQPEYMHNSAANGILKILEEPPPQTFFLLVSNNAERLMPTILSRTQHVIVPLLQDEDIETVLSTDKTLSAERRKKIVGEAEGNLHLALGLVDTEEEDHYEVLATWLRACYKRDYQKMVTQAEEFHEFDRMRQQSLLHYALILLRESLLFLSGGESLQRSRNGEQKFIQDFSKVMNLSKLERSQALVTEASYHLERNGSAKMIFLDLSLQLSRTLNP